MPGAGQTYAYGIDGSNIVGTYHDGSNYRGFIATIPDLNLQRYHFLQ